MSSDPVKIFVGESLVLDSIKFTLKSRNLLKAN